MQNITTVGIDLAKNVYQIHGVDKAGKVVLQKRVTRTKFMETMSKLPSCLVGIEACGGSNYWARRMQELGHEVRMMSPQHVKPYIGSSKNDYKDAAGICEAVGRPRMLFVPQKSKDQQDIQSVHRVRNRLIGSRTALVNQMRGLLAEYGEILPQGVHQVRTRLWRIIEDGANDLSSAIRETMSDLYDELVGLDGRIARYDSKIEQIYESNEACQKLGKIEGIGPISATALVAAVGDGQAFKNGRQMAAWLGLTPRQHSSGEKEKLLGISKRGDSYVRYLLIHGARSATRASAKKCDKKSVWIQDKVIRRGKNKAAVALANKTARTAWALLTQGTVYKVA